jgi:7-dehydrocholesterol reductase
MMMIVDDDDDDDDDDDVLPSRYLFELMAAWSWCLLGTNLGFGGGSSNGLLPLFYASFLTVLLIHRAQRDEEKCLDKYGDGYREYMRRVPYKIIPGVY